MKFRNARHTNDLEAISSFYTEVIGLERLGSFENHSGYNGIFLGFPHIDWHLEYTQSSEPANHHPDRDDLMVFYVNSREEMNAIRKDAEKFGVKIVKSKNPYWQINGIELKDPDNFGIIISIKEKQLLSNDNLTQLVKNKGVATWGQLLDYVRTIPYGRNADRTAFGLVISEYKGTCSTKHALMKSIAISNGITDVELLLSIYKMSPSNTSGIGNILSKNNLEYIPEAHCYLKVNGKRIDVTNSTSDIQSIENDILEEKIISPDQVGDFKVAYHKKYLMDWIESNAINKSFDELWKIREQCIKELEKREIVTLN